MASSRPISSASAASAMLWKREAMLLVAVAMIEHPSFGFG
jgi:hypothetical protein